MPPPHTLLRQLRIVQLGATGVRAQVIDKVVRQLRQRTHARSRHVEQVFGSHGGVRHAFAEHRMRLDDDDLQRHQGLTQQLERDQHTGRPTTDDGDHCIAGITLSIHGGIVGDASHEPPSFAARRPCRSGAGAACITASHTANTRSATIGRSTSARALGALQHVHRVGPADPLRARCRGGQGVFTKRTSRYPSPRRSPTSGWCSQPAASSWRCTRWGNLTTAADGTCTRQRSECGKHRRQAGVRHHYRSARASAATAARRRACRRTQALCRLCVADVRRPRPGGNVFQVMRLD